jgi:predicted dinucleotide-binding enzyme
MKIGILGSGAVGVTLAKGFVSEGHDVWIATREPDSDKGKQLATDVEGATVTDFPTAVQEAELAVLCVKWAGAEEMVRRAGVDNLAGKIVIDTSNLITQEKGALVYAAPATSGAELVQSWLLNSKVVKAFNTVGAAMMYKPDFGEMLPTMFIAGEDDDAKQQVGDIVTAFGWEPLDTGGIIMARCLEPMALVWINNSMKSGSPHHAFKML